MSKTLTFISILNLADWIIALFIAGTSARIQARDKQGNVLQRRTPLAVALAIFFLVFGTIRLAELLNLIVHAEELRSCVGLVSDGFNLTAIFISSAKTLAFLFCWFGVTMELRERKGILSGNVIRNFLTRWFDKLR